MQMKYPPFTTPELMVSQRNAVVKCFPTVSVSVSLLLTRRIRRTLHRRAACRLVSLLIPLLLLWRRALQAEAAVRAERTRRRHRGSTTSVAVHVAAALLWRWWRRESLVLSRHAALLLLLLLREVGLLLQALALVFGVFVLDEGEAGAAYEQIVEETHFC